MPIDLKRYRTIKADVDRMQRETDRAAGALAQLMERLKEEHGCSTMEEAEKLASELEKKVEEMERNFEEKLAEFEDEWESVLAEEDNAQAPNLSD